MKKIIITLVFAILCLNTNARIEFAPKSAIWYYESNNIAQFGNGVLYSTIQYDHDTIIKGRSWKVLKQLNYSQFKKPYSSSHIIIREDSGVVRIWMDTFSNILVDFNLHHKGDSMLFRDTASTSSGYVWHSYLDSIGTITISGQKRQISYFVIGTGPAHIRFVEGIGDVYEGFIPYEQQYRGLAYTYMGTLRCYQDSVINFHNNLDPTYPVAACDSIITYTGINENAKPINNSAWVAYPNPVFSTLVLKNTMHEALNEGSYIEIYTITGQRVYKENLLSGQDQIDVDFSLLPKGLYLVKVNSHYHQSITKIIKI